MSPVSIPWAGTTLGDAGPYSDEDWRQIYAKLYGIDYNTILAGIGPAEITEYIGVFQRFMDGMRVTASSPAAATVDVQPGAAIVAGTIVSNVTFEQVAIASNSSGNPRKDLIVCRVLRNQQQAQFTVRQGTPAASPVPLPPLITSTVWDIPLAIVNVANGFITITQADIEDARLYADFAPGTAILLLNNSGATIEPGRIVRLASGTDSAMNYCPRNEADDMIGVTAGRIENGDRGMVVTEGIVWMKAAVAITRGDKITPNSAVINGEAAKDDLGRYIARALAGANAGEFFPAYVHRTDERGTITQQADSVTGSDFTTASTTYVDTPLRITTFVKYLNDSVLEFNAQLLCGISVDNAAEDIELRNYTDATSYVPVITYSTGTGSGGLFESKSFYRRISGLPAGTYDLGLRCKTSAGTARINLASRFEIKEVKA